MTISKDLLLAILSLDSYNRDYGAGIAGLGGKGSKVGTTTILDDSDILTDENGDRVDVSAGFYAIAYDTADYGTVISYRGTDDPLGGGVSGSDIWNGWIGATGLPTGQAALAFDFFESVTGADAFDGNNQGTILTGHSLGGGLAGLVGSLSGDEAIIFDNMPNRTLAR